MALYTFGGTPADVLTTTTGDVVPDWPLLVRVAGTGELITALYQPDGVTPLGELRSNPVGSSAPGAIPTFKCEIPAIEYEYLDAAGAPVRWYQDGRELTTDALTAATDALTATATKLDTIAGGTVEGPVVFSQPITAPGLTDFGAARLFVVEGAVGDGIADDRLGIQAALDAAHTAGGGTVVIPAGRTYGVGTFLVVYDNTTIYAYGATLRAIGTGAGLLRNFLSSETFAGYSGHSHITVLGGTWDGNAADGASGTVTAVTDVLNFIHARDITIRDATVTNTSSAHALEFNAVDGGRAINCRFLGFKDTSPEQNRGTSEAIQLDMAKAGSSSIGDFDNTPAKNILVQGCYFGPSDRLGVFGRAVGSHAAAAGVYFDGIQVIGNRVEGAAAEGVHGYCWRRSVIADNVISGTGATGIRLTHPNPATAGFSITPHSLVITGNTIDAPATDAGITVFGYTTAQVSGVKIADNVVRSSGNTGIRCDYCTSPSITANTVDTASSTGIFVQAGSGAVLASNTVRAVGSNGINITSSAGATVTGNQVDTTTSNHGIFVGTLGDALITGNHVVAAASAGIRLSDNAVRCTVTGNKVRKGTGSTVNGVSAAPTATGAVITGNDLSGNGWTAAVALVVTGSGAVLDWAGGTTSPGHNRI
ncbi:right-handed parallel beta-helix repeat-containing protein [Streptomyces sp. NPDC102437]|uniref:right-handed parallel beta-helix repeat-containing protein n=1 Tax=Streptomyces sp. NPDC102437 TaxID=3366175 RepID=UPI0038040901